MSSQAIRDAARAMVQDASWPGPPFLESVSTRVDDAAKPDLYCTLDFEAFSDERMSLGTPACWTESGVIRLPIMSKSGEGDAAAVAAHDAAKAAVFAWGGWPGGFHIEAVDAPSHFDAAGEGSWYRLECDITYTWDHQLP